VAHDELSRSPRPGRSHKSKSSIKTTTTARQRQEIIALRQQEDELDRQKAADVEIKKKEAAMKQRQHDRDRENEESRRLEQEAARLLDDDARMREEDDSRRREQESRQRADDARRRDEKDDFQRRENERIRKEEEAQLEIDVLEEDIRRVLQQVRDRRKLLEGDDKSESKKSQSILDELPERSTSEWVRNVTPIDIDETFGATLHTPKSEPQEVDHPRSIATQVEYVYPVSTAGLPHRVMASVTDTPIHTRIGRQPVNSLVNTFTETAMPTTVTSAARSVPAVRVVSTATGTRARPIHDGLANPAERTPWRPTEPVVQHTEVPAPKSNFERSLPKIVLAQFSGDPLEWPEWAGMFKATVDSSRLTDSEKMNYLKTLLTGKAKQAVAGMGYSGEMYHVAWSTLEKKFGQPHIIVASQLSLLMKHPAVRMHDSAGTVAYSVVVANFFNVLRQFNYMNDLYSSSNLNAVIGKLPPDMKTGWFTHITKKGIPQPNLIEFNDWFQDKATVSERLLSLTSTPVNTTTQDKSAKGFKGNLPGRQNSSNFAANESQKTGKDSSGESNYSSKGSKECPLQDGTHRLWTCYKFKNKTVSERYDLVKQLRLCFSCLSADHRIRDCKAPKCGVNGCERRHNKLLHSNTPREVKPDEVKKEAHPTLLSKSEAVDHKGLLQIVPLRVYGKHGFTDTMAVCDTGSTQTWIDDAFRKKIGLAGTPTTLNIAGIHGTSEVDSHIVHMKIGSTLKNGVKPAMVKSYSHPRLNVGSNVYDVKKLKQEYPHLDCLSSENVDLSRVKVLLGQDAFHLIRPLEYKSSNDKSPWAVRLPLGWTLSGPLPSQLAEDCVSTFYARCTEDTQLVEQVRHWWDIESYASRCQVLSRTSEDKRAQQLLDETTTHDGERYKVGLLWSQDDATLPNNYGSALGQLKSLEQRLRKDPALEKKYVQTISTDLEKGYIRKISRTELMDTKDLRQWYLPHHPVINPNKPEKVRRVCNAAAQYAGTSLNQNLLIGPDLLRSLFGVVFRFREGPIALTADIEAMFLQVEVKDDDQRALRFLWREDPSSEKVEVYQFTRHIFGAKSSPTCANYALQRTASDNFKKFPIAAATVQRNFYMDDLLKSCGTVEEAKKVSSELRQLMKLGGFTLAKWTSSHPDVLPRSMVDTTAPQVVAFRAPSSDEEESSTVLGLKWHVTNDTLEVCRGVDKTPPVVVTQRSILSLVSSVFDPLGMAGPFTIQARLLLKSIWQSCGQDWDKPVDDEQREKFLRWCSELSQLNNMRVPRYYFSGKDTMTDIQLHIFGDASQDAMCVIAYFRAECSDGSTVTPFIVGKTRVAPLRHLTIPKLELQAAMTAIRLYDLISKEHEIKPSRVVFWTDSTTVLQWIRSSNKKQPTFVANRVAEILESSTVDQWRHVPGELNPADCGTRGFSPTELLESEWLNGPAWLRKPAEEWPPDFVAEEPGATIQNDDVALMATEAHEPIIDWKRFGKFQRLVNTVARMKRFSNRARKKPLPSSTVLQADEIADSKEVLWKLVQRESFAKELKELTKGNPCPSSSTVAAMSPFLDADGLMRAKGRLRKASLPFVTKHPILLHSQHPAVELFLRQQHIVHFHEGVEYLRSVIQQEFWIVRLRSALRAIKNSCITCKKQRAQNFSPEMADLPSERLQDHAFPFASTGVDYFGPFEVKFNRKPWKRWCCLFTCLTTRAVHIEVVHSLDTDSCLMAIRRFIARRGRPKTMVSDNGTNFVGAFREFKEYPTDRNSNAIEKCLAQENIAWKFNPPSAPHFGGVWERLVRSCKKAMYNILGSTRLTEEVLTTVMSLVEQTLNARPLTAVSSDPEDLEALTTNHFLLGRPSVALPFYWTSPKDVNHRKTFRNCEAYADIIWQRWQKEYVLQLNRRSKWHQESASKAKVGELVWILESGSKRSQYPLARILETYASDDGQIRSAKVKTAT
jgi:hypothetical protein